METPYSLFKTNDKMETEGVVLNYGSFDIRIARAGGANKKYMKLLQARMKPHKRQMDTDTLPEKTATDILAACFADAVILGWTGVKDEEGKDMEFTRENVIKLMTDLPDLFRDVQQQANLVSNFRAAEIEEIAKNS
jgi:hypothetical protein